MKKLFALALATLMVLSLMTGCGSKTTDETDYSTMTLEELKPLINTLTDGKLTMVTSPDFAPYEFYALDAEGKPSLAGFDIALAHYIADMLGLELEIIPMDFNGTIMELSNNKADIGMAGYSPDPKRAKSMDYTDVYYTGGQSFVTVKDKADLFPDLAATNKAEYQIGAQIGSIQAKLAQEFSPESDIVTLGKVTDIIGELLSGKLDGAYIETVPAQSYATSFPELAIVLDVPYEAEGSVIGVSKGNAPLLAAVNLCIKAAQDDGSLAKFVAEAIEQATGDIHEGLLETPAN